MSSVAPQPTKTSFNLPRLALALGGLEVLLLVTGLLLGLESAGKKSGFAGLVLFGPFTVVGALIAFRQPRNAIGWVLIALVLTCTLALDAGDYSVLANSDGYHLPLGRLAAALAPFWVPLLVLLPLPVGLFPDGHIPGGRWRWTFWAYLSVAAAFVIWRAVPDLKAFTADRVRVDTIGQLTALGSSSGAQNDFAIAYGVTVLGMVVYQLARFRRSRGDERQQLKWLIAGGAIAVACFASASWVSGAPGGLILGLVALPVGLAIGVLKYRLYDIDRLISRTISYALLTAMVAGVFLGIVVLMTRVLPFSSPVAVAASTLAAAAIFNPLRRRTQRLIDRRFNRSHYDAQAEVAAFSGRLRDALDLEAIRGELLHVVDQTIAPEHASVWIRPER